MSCDEEALSEFLDGELAPERRAAVQAHLDTCAPCRAVLARLTAGSAAFKAAGSPRAPEGLAAGALKRAAPGREVSGRGPRWVPAALLGALTFGLFAAGKAVQPQVSGIFNQLMGMVSGAASTVGSGDGGGLGPSTPPAPGSSAWLWVTLACLAVIAAIAVRSFRRRR